MHLPKISLKIQPIDVDPKAQGYHFHPNPRNAFFI